MFAPRPVWTGQFPWSRAGKAEDRLHCTDYGWFSSHSRDGCFAARTGAGVFTAQASWRLKERLWWRGRDGRPRGCNYLGDLYASWKRAGGSRRARFGLCPSRRPDRGWAFLNGRCRPKKSCRSSTFRVRSSFRLCGNAAPTSTGVLVSEAPGALYFAALVHCRGAGSAAIAWIIGCSGVCSQTGPKMGVGAGTLEREKNPRIRCAALRAGSRQSHGQRSLVAQWRAVGLRSCWPGCLVEKQRHTVWRATRCRRALCPDPEPLIVFRPTLFAAGGCAPVFLLAGAVEHFLRCEVRRA